jgi:hypothetical protein
LHQWFLHVNRRIDQDYYHYPYDRTCTYWDKSKTILTDIFLPINNTDNRNSSQNKNCLVFNKGNIDLQLANCKWDSGRELFSFFFGGSLVFPLYDDALIRIHKMRWNWLPLSLSRLNYVNTVHFFSMTSSTHQFPIRSQLIDGTNTKRKRKKSQE